jgi:uncharacterized membrane protein
MSIVNAAAIALHTLSAIVWVGGMFFAYMCLRPVAASQLEPPQRLPLWIGTFGRFFPWVWGIILLLPLTGFGMAHGMFGGMGQWPLYVHLMMGLGIVMIMIYLHVFFAPFRRLKEAVANGDFKEGGRRLGQIRQLVGINLILGLLVSVIASAGRYL